MANEKEEEFWAIDDGADDRDDVIGNANLKHNCYTCKHFNGKHSCAAFPDQIPNDILAGNKPHRERIRGQEGDFVWAKKEEKTEKG